MGKEQQEKPPARKAPPAKGSGLRTFNVFVDGEYFEVGVEEIGAPSRNAWGPPMSRPAAVAAPPSASHATPGSIPASAPQPAAPQPVCMPAGGTNIDAPMPGMVIRYEVKEGDAVNAGEVLLILEAMKMENSITSPVTGIVLKINHKDGDSVQKGDILAVVG